MNELLFAKDSNEVLAFFVETSNPRTNRIDGEVWITLLTANHLIQSHVEHADKSESQPKTTLVRRSDIQSMQLACEGTVPTDLPSDFSLFQIRARYTSLAEPIIVGASREEGFVRSGRYDSNYGRLADQQLKFLNELRADLGAGKTPEQQA